MSFIINGSEGKSGAFQLRQGCPLLPYLFLLCTKALSILILRSEQDGKTLGIRWCRGSPLVSHLFFADYSILFCKASIGNCNKIKGILVVYGNASS